MQKSVQTLPEGYNEIYSVNLQKDKKTAVILNVVGGVICAAILALGHFCFVPFSEFGGSGENLFLDLLPMLAMIVGVFAYIVLHELTHGAVMKLFGAKKLRFGFTGLYAYAGSETDYFGKSVYILVALAPLVFWGVVLTVLLIFVPRNWFWTVYFIQMMNISGAVGDLFVTFKFMKMPKDILVMDTGVGMTVYSKQNN